MILASNPPPLGRINHHPAGTQHRGVLLKGAAILDALAACRVVAFDKTGTLTSGALSCTLVANPAAPTPYLDTAGSEQLPPVAGHAVAVAVALSQRSNHPVSTAIEALARLPAVQAALPLEIADFQLVPGAGVRGTVVQGGQRSAVRLGSVEFAAQGLSAGQRQRLDASLGALVEKAVGSCCVGLMNTAVVTMMTRGCLCAITHCSDCIPQYLVACQHHQTNNAGGRIFYTSLCCESLSTPCISPPSLIFTRAYAASRVQPLVFRHPVAHVPSAQHAMLAPVRCRYSPCSPRHLPPLPTLKR